MLGFQRPTGSMSQLVCELVTRFQVDRGLSVHSQLLVDFRRRGDRLLGDYIFAANWANWDAQQEKFHSQLCSHQSRFN